MMVPNLTATGSGSSVPGTPGRSVELRTTETAIQWRQTGGEWADLVLLSDITGTNGDPGKNVELRTTATAIQWRQVPDGVWADLVQLAALQGADGKSIELSKSATAIIWRETGGEFSDLVQLADLKGDPGEGADIVVTTDYVDVGVMRMAWGKADYPASGVATVNFPAPFAVPPVVQITGVGPSADITPKVITTNGFVVGEVNSRSNPMPFGWMAIGQNPDAAPAPAVAFDVPGLPVWSAAVRAQRAGLRSAKVLCIGDSTTAGHGAVAADMGSNAKSASYPTRLAERFAAKGSAASWASFFGNQVTFDVPGYDNRITIGAGWTTTANGYGQMLGGYGMISAETTRTRFAPTSTVDTFEIYTLQRLASTAPMFVVSVDDVDVSTIWSVHSQDAPGILMKTVVKTTPGTHAVSIRSVASNINVQLAGILAYNSAAPDIAVLNAGWAGGKASSFANNQFLSWSPLLSIPVHNPDLVIINLGINDMNQATPTTKAAYVSQMQEIITASVSTGADVVLVIPNAIGGTYTANHAIFAGYIQELAAANGLTVVDLRTKLGTYTAANAAGYMRDAVHPTGSGYLKIAEAIQEVIMP